MLKANGLLGVIVSNTWLQSVTLRKVRQYLTNNYQWLRLLHLPEKVFNAVVDTHVLIFQKSREQDSDQVEVDVRRGSNIGYSHSLSWRDVPKDGEPINIVASSEAQHLYRRIVQQSSRLLQICHVFNGIKPFEKGKGDPPQTAKTLSERPYVTEGPQPSDLWSPLLRGSLIQRYDILWRQNYWVLYGPWLAAPRDPAIFSAPIKIMVRQTGDSIIATLVEQGYIARNNMHILLPKDDQYNLSYILGLMNSKLLNFVYSLMNPEKGEALAEVKKHHVEQLPIRTINFADAADNARHDRMVALVERMLDLQKRKAAAFGHERTVIERQIAATDDEIDRLVYELYDLTPDEIAIVEAATR